MSRSLEDNVEPILQLGTSREENVETVAGKGFNKDALLWDVIEMEVNLSQVATPNYAKGKIKAKPVNIETINKKINEELDTNNNLQSINGISVFVGSHFRLEARNQFVQVAQDSENDNNRIQERAATNLNQPGESLLFNGRVANISPAGDNTFDVTAFDPGQQAFNFGAGSGSIINQNLNFSGDNVTITSEINFDSEEVDESVLIKPEDILNTIVNESAIGEAEITNDFQLLSSKSDEALEKFAGGPGGAVLPPSSASKIYFSESVVPVKDALDKIRERAGIEIWFDKDGTFYAGDPANGDLVEDETKAFNIRLITDTSAGITTPAYQSVQVIVPGSTNRSDVSDTDRNIFRDDDNKTVVNVNIAQPKSGGSQANNVLQLFRESDISEVDDISLQPPTYQYVSEEISTDEQAQRVALKIADDLRKQQGSGEITIVGMPEVQPFDAVVTPSSNSQPMGGQTYGVFSVTHLINNSDGFKTKIEVAGPTIRDLLTVGAKREDLVAASVGTRVVSETPSATADLGEIDDATFINEIERFRDASTRRAKNNNDPEAQSGSNPEAQAGSNSDLGALRFAALPLFLLSSEDSNENNDTERQRIDRKATGREIDTPIINLLKQNKILERLFDEEEDKEEDEEDNDDGEDSGFTPTGRI